MDITHIRFSSFLPFYTFKLKPIPGSFTVETVFDTSKSVNLIDVFSVFYVT